jgi:dienelactone hydrolase
MFTRPSLRGSSGHTGLGESEISAKRWTSSGLSRCALVVALLVAFACVTGAACRAADPNAFEDAPLNETVIRVPVAESPAVTLEVTILHPDGRGPFPLAIMNHGANNASTSNPGVRYRQTYVALYFLSRGYAVALPMMRGFAASGGQMHHFGCDLEATGIANAKDIRTVIRFLGNDPRFDTRRVVVAGQSLGGWNTLALGALSVANVAGLIDFNGGLRESDCAAGDRALEAGTAAFGARTRVPSIWFYGENDPYFSVPVWRSMYAHYTLNGGRAELVDIGVFMNSSHNFLSYAEALPLWVPRVDAFLADIGMPSAVVDPWYLPPVASSPRSVAAVP